MTSAKQFCQEVSNDAITSTPCANSRSSITLRSSINKSFDFGVINSAKKYLTPNRSYNLRAQENLFSVVKEYSEIIQLRSGKSLNKSNNNSQSLRVSVQKRKLFTQIPVKIAKKIKISEKSSPDNNVKNKNKEVISKNKEKSNKKTVLNNVESSQTSDKESTIEDKDNCDKNNIAEDKPSKELAKNTTNVSDSNNRMSGSSFNNRSSSKPSFIRRKLYSNICDFTEHETAKTFETSFLKKNSIINIYDQPQTRVSNEIPDNNNSLPKTVNKRSSIPKNDKINEVKKVYPLRNKSDKDLSNNSHDNIINKTINFKTIPKESTCNYIAHLLKDISNDTEKNVSENVSKIDKDLLNESEKMFDFDETATPPVKKTRANNKTTAADATKSPNKPHIPEKKTLSRKNVSHKKEIADLEKSTLSLSKRREIVKRGTEKVNKPKVKETKTVAKVSTSSKKNSEDEKKKKISPKTNKTPKDNKNKANKIEKPAKINKTASEPKPVKSKKNVPKKDSFTDEIVKKWEDSFNDVEKDNEIRRNDMCMKYNQRSIPYFNLNKMDNGKINHTNRLHHEKRQYSESEINVRQGKIQSYDDVLGNDRDCLESGQFNKYSRPFFNNWRNERNANEQFSNDHCTDRRIVSSSFFNNGRGAATRDSRICNVSVKDKSYRDVTKMLNQELLKEINTDRQSSRNMNSVKTYDETFKVPVGYPKRQNYDNRIVYEHSRRVDMYTENDHNDEFIRRHGLFSENNDNDDFGRRYSTYGRNNYNNNYDDRPPSRRIENNRNIDVYRERERNYDLRRCDVPRLSNYMNSTNRPSRIESAIPNHTYLQNNLPYQNVVRNQPFMDVDYDPRIRLENFGHNNYSNRYVSNSNQSLRPSRYNEDMNNIRDHPIMERYRNLHDYSATTNNKFDDGNFYQTIKTVKSKTVLAPMGIACSTKTSATIGMPERNVMVIEESIDNIPHSFDDNMIKMNTNKYASRNNFQYKSNDGHSELMSNHASDRFVGNKNIATVLSDDIHKSNGNNVLRSSRYDDHFDDVDEGPINRMTNGTDDYAQSSIRLQQREAPSKYISSSRRDAINNIGDDEVSSHINQNISNVISTNVESIPKSNGNNILKTYNIYDRFDDIDDSSVMVSHKAPSNRMTNGKVTNDYAQSSVQQRGAPIKNISSLPIPGCSSRKDAINYIGQDEVRSYINENISNNVESVPKSNGNNVLKTFNIDDIDDSSVFVLNKDPKNQIAGDKSLFKSKQSAAMSKNISSFPVAGSSSSKVAMNCSDEDVPNSDDDSWIVHNKPEMNLSPWRYKY